MSPLPLKLKLVVIYNNIIIQFQFIKKHDHDEDSGLRMDESHDCHARAAMQAYLAVLCCFLGLSDVSQWVHGTNQLTGRLSASSWHQSAKQTRTHAMEAAILNFLIISFNFDKK